MKNPFANLFKKKDKSENPVPTPDAGGKKKESFFNVEGKTKYEKRKRWN